MRRNLALISAAVTAFTVVVLVSVVYAYSGFAASQSNSTPNSDPAVKTIQVSPAAANSQSQSVAPAAASVSQTTTLSPQDAGSLAAQFLHRTDLLSAQLASYNGTPAYKITFVSGEVAYVSMSGQILGVVPAAATAAPPLLGSSGSGGGSHRSGGGGSYGGEHEGGDGGGD